MKIMLTLLNITYENFFEHCRIEKEQMLNPKIKVVGIDNTFNMSLTEIEQDVNERNFKNYDTKCQAVHIGKSTELLTFDFQFFCFKKLS